MAVINIKSDSANPELDVERINKFYKNAFRILKDVDYIFNFRYYPTEKRFDIDQPEVENIYEYLYKIDYHYRYNEDKKTNIFVSNIADYR